MLKIASMKPKTNVLLSIALIALISTGSKLIHADDSTNVERTVIREEVRSELERLINEEGLFDKAIERGINAYVQKQQALARANKQRERSAKAKNVRPVDDKDHIYGNPSAEISLIEYSDFECPYCKRFHPTAKQLVDKSNGQVNWVYRHFPLAFHNPGAQKQAEASECAAKLGGNDAFWLYTDHIYARTRSNGKGFPIENLVPLAEEMGLNAAEFKGCLESGEMTARVKADYKNGAASGISGTPGNFLLHNASGDALVMSGALPLSRLQAGVNRLKKRHAKQ